MNLILSKRNRLAWVGVILSIATLALAIRGVHWSQVLQALKGANYLLLALALCLLIVCFCLRTPRWAALFEPIARLSLWQTFGALCVGYAVNNLLPLRMGELARASLICHKQSVDAGHATSTIVIERTLDTITVVGLLAIILPFIDAPAWARGPAILLGICFLFFAVILAVTSFAENRALLITGRLLKFLPSGVQTRAQYFVETAIRGLSVFRSPRLMARIIVLTVASWVLSGIVMYVVMKAFDLDVPLTAGLFVMCATSLSAVVPSSPGYIGVFHAVAIESLVRVFGVDRDDAATFALVQHAMLYLLPIVLAAIYLLSEPGAWNFLSRTRNQSQVSST